MTDTIVVKPEVTAVVFRKWKNGDIIALFPLENADLDNAGLCSSFEHVGQHGSADYNGVISRTRPATPTEYDYLKAELEDTPYNYKLRVLLRAPNGHYDKRRKPIDNHWANVRQERERQQKEYEESYEFKRKRWDEAVKTAKE